MFRGANTARPDDICRRRRAGCQTSVRSRVGTGWSGGRIIGLATEAVELMRLRSPDVVVTDLQMPTHDGIWLFRETKIRLPNVPVIAVSEHIDESRVDDLRRRGFAEVLRKPVLLSELTNAVARAVGG